MQAWIDRTPTPVADVAELDAILGRRPPEGVTLASDDGRRILHINFHADRSDLYWETRNRFSPRVGAPVPPGAPADQVVDDAEYAYDNPWFALPDGAEPFEISAVEARRAAHGFLRTGARPTNVQWVVKP